MADRRKFRGRSSFNIGGMLSGIAGDGGGIENDPEAVADVAAETPYWDDTFDANNVLRYKPSSGIKDFLSGGKSSAMASKYNADANASEVANRINREDATTLFNRKLEEDDHRLTNQLVGNRLEYDDRIKRLARSLENESVGNYLVGEDDAPLEEFMQEAQANVNNYGDQSKIHGFLGAPLQADNTQSEIDFRRKQTELAGKGKTGFEEMKDGSILDHTNNVLIEKVPNDPLDPTKGYSYRRRDLNMLGVNSKPNPVATTNNPTGPKPTGNGILGGIKKLFAAEPQNVEPEDFTEYVPALGDSNLYDLFGVNPNNLVPDFIKNAKGTGGLQYNGPLPSTQPAENVDDALKSYLNTDSAKALELLRQKKIKGIKAPLRTY